MKSLFSAYVNLLKTSIGSGVLNFPYLFKTYGFLSTIIFTIISGFFATTGLFLLIVCSEDIGREANLSKLASLTIPFAKIIVDFAVFLKCFGVATSYMIIVSTLLPSVLGTFFESKYLTYPPFCLAIFVCFIGPYCYLKKMDRLKYTSFLGLLAIVFVVAASIFRFSHDGYSSDAKYNFISTPLSIFWLGGFGKFVFSFTCHQNIFYVYSELEDNSIGRMKKLILLTAFSAFILYLTFGGSNYLLFGSKVKENVLMNYPEDYLTTIVHGLYVIIMGVSYPLQLGPGKSYFLNMINFTPKHRGFNFMSYLTTTVLIVATYFIAVSGVGLGFVYTIVGATASTFMSLILPAIFYLHMDTNRSIFLTIIAYFSFLFGVFVFFTTLISVAIKIPIGH
ncbi:hypothetical protein NUSPORA_02404 [Nucleospora cyclopteri]